MSENGQGTVDEIPAPSAAFLAGMKLSQTPQQQEVARQIYDRLAAGASVDDIHDLIEKMMRTVVTQRHDRATTPTSDSTTDNDDLDSRRW